MFGMLLDLDAVQVKFNGLMKVQVTGKNSEVGKHF